MRRRFCVALVVAVLATLAVACGSKSTGGGGGSTVVTGDDGGGTAANLCDPGTQACMTDADCKCNTHCEPIADGTFQCTRGCAVGDDTRCSDLGKTTPWTCQMGTMGAFCLGN
jgi:hypothetical protein